MNVLSGVLRAFEFFLEWPLKFWPIGDPNRMNGDVNSNGGGGQHILHPFCKWFWANHASVNADVLQKQVAWTPIADSPRGLPWMFPKRFLFC
jgi:hypothetical protein